ncbi:hypothetical protein ACQPWW_20825 [Micromonospora sp. CA-240977]|uniref:hypothetical protein n=1 Tax=Micromonospora sp. CA-240977 TaxID=3239957 RepID=UPI003D8B2337
MTANRLIDEAAVAAGRDPREIRRLLNLFTVDVSSRSRGFLQGPPEQWVEQLLPLVLDEGVSTFLIGRDDPHLIQTFGQEIAPALRDAVAKERAAAGPGAGRVRTVAALAERHPSLDYDALPQSLAARSVEPGDREYEGVRHS